MKKSFITKLTVIALTFVLSMSAAQADDFIITTGSQGGGYERLGHMFMAQIKQQKVDLDLEVVNSNGSVENIECINTGECQAAIVQLDALNINPPKGMFKTKYAHTEKVLWLYNKGLGFSDLSDIEGKKDVFIVIVDGSGAQVTLNSFVQEDAGYKVNADSAIYADDFYEAVSIVADGRSGSKKVAGTLYVGASIPAEIANDFKDKVLVGEATDSDFNDAEDINGEPLYTNCEIEKQVLRGMNTSTWSNPSTVCVKAAIVYKADYDKKTMKALNKAATKATRGLQ